MKLVIFALACHLSAFAADINGQWKVWFVRPGEGPKTVGSILLNLQTDGGKVTGDVVIGAWPGAAPIADGKIAGDEITFTATGSRSSTTGIPTCQFSVRMQNGEMVVIMTVIKNAGGPLGANVPYEFRGKRDNDSASR